MATRHDLGTGEEFSWTTWDQEPFLARQWRPAGSIQRVLIAIHGLSGAAQDFSPLGVRLGEQGWAVYAAELRGQGRDPLVKRRGDLVQVEDWYRDLDSFFQLIQHRHPEVPWVLAGESMGAVIALSWLRWAQGGKNTSWTTPRGLMLFSPVVAIDHPISLWQELLFRGLSRILPTCRVKLGKFAPQDERDLRVTRDESYQEYIYTSPHHLDSYSLRFVRHLGELIQGCATVPVREDLPVWIPYAQHDVFIQPRLVEQYFEQLSVRDKTKQLYPEGFHCLLHDLDVDQVLSDTEKWLARILPN